MGGGQESGPSHPDGVGPLGVILGPCVIHIDYYRDKRENILIIM